MEANNTGRAAQLLWLTLAILVCWRVLSRVVRQSFFFDGNIYTSIARNLADGMGSSWRLHFSDTLFPLFSEHPPLMMMIQSVGFKIFGDTILVDKGFTLLTFIGSGMILAGIWCRLNEYDRMYRLALPFALIMALIGGRVGWAFANGMLENLLIVFTSLAVLFVVEAYREGQSNRSGRRLSLMVAVGVAIFAALLTKGPVGLFPLATPAIYWVAFRRPPLAHVVADSLVVLGVVAFLCAALWQFDAPRMAVERYYSIQVLSSLAGERGNASGGWAAARTFLRVNAYTLLITLSILCSAAYLKRELGLRGRGNERLNRSVFMLMVGFSASLPLFVSPRVSSFYFNPSLLYFGAGLAALCAPRLVNLLADLGEASFVWLRRSLYAALGVSVIYVGAVAGSLGEDGSEISDARKIAGQVCANESGCSRIVATCGEVWQNWALHAYLQRNHKLSLADFLTSDSMYLLADESCAVTEPGFREVDAGLSDYRLLQRANSDHSP